MLVITLTKVPLSLRGDLTKWCQEIQSGVYVGNVNARIRDALWQRIIDSIGHGEATMVYNTNNELGYQFRTTRNDKEVIDFDGIPLMMSLKEAPLKRRLGFSKAYRHHQAVVYERHRLKNQAPHTSFVVVDVETTGIELENDQIISIGAVKSGKGKLKEFYQLIKSTREVPREITKLTGIDNQLLKQSGIPLKDGLQALHNFSGSQVIISYNVNFDRHFLQKGCDRAGVNRFENSFIDLMKVVKKHNLFLDNYRLETVLNKYGIKNERPHNALSDAKAEFELSKKLIENGVMQF